MARISKKKKALLDAFGDRYIHLEWKDGYLLYDKETSGKRSNNKYLGWIDISDKQDCYVFNDKEYPTLDELLTAIEEYNATLPFDPDIYNPMYKKNYMIECAVHDYLTELGFVTEHSSNETFYVLKDPYGQDICTITYDVKEDTTDGAVRRIINSSRWMEITFNDLDSAIGAINTHVAAYCSITNIVLMKSLNKLTESRSAKILNKKFDIQTLTVYTEDATQQTIDFLEAELKRLKEKVNG